MSDPLPDDLPNRLRELLSDDSGRPAGEAGPERIGRLAIMHGYLTLGQLNGTLAEQQLQVARGEKPELLGQILLRKRLLDPEGLERLLKIQSQGPIVPRLKRYETREPVGEGALAVVYRAFDRDLGRDVAIKVLKETALLHEAARERLRREAHALARLSHPHVVTVHDFGEEGGRIYLVIELVHGKTLRKLLEEGAPDPRALLTLLLKVADGVHHAHEHGIVHRDLKPENILLTESGEPKVADFGLAHLAESDLALTRTGAKQGTPLYMAPEQVEGRSRDVTAATDVYALGAILYEMLAGSPPFTGESMAAVFAKILSEDPKPLRKTAKGIHPELETIALKALSKDPARRYSSAKSFSDDLRRHLSGEPISTRPPGIPYRAYRAVRKHPIAAILAAGTLLGAASAVLAWRSLEDRARTAEQNRAVARETIRSAARVSLDAALGFRRLGANDRMMQSLPPLEEAYRRALDLAPDLAEVDYLLGRMYRVLMQPEKALELQEQALRKDSRFAPALYERVVLVSARYGSQLRNSYNPLPIPAGIEVTPETARRVSDPTLPVMERGRSDLVEVRERLIRDCELLEELLKDPQVRSGAPVPMSDANIAAVKGLLAYHRGRFDQAHALLREAVEKDSLLEEAWEHLAKATSESPATDAAQKHDRWTEALRFYGEALSHDRGYVPHLLGRADVFLVRGDDRMCHGEDPLADFAASEQDLSEALRLKKSMSTLLRGRADVRMARGVYRLGRGEDPLPDFAASLADYDAALRPDARVGAVLRRRGQLTVHRAHHRILRGEDPLADLAAAERDLSEALSRNGKDEAAWYALGTLHLLRGPHSAGMGRDPSGDYEAADRELTEAIRLFVIVSGPWRNRGHVRMLKGLRCAETGGDPSEQFRKAEEDLVEASQRALQRGTHSGRLASEFPPAWVMRARLRTEWAAWRIRSGRSPEDDFAVAEQDLQKALAFHPSDPEAFEARGRLREVQGDAFERGGDKDSAARAYQSSAEDLRTAARLNPFLERRIAPILLVATRKADRLKH